MLMPPAPHLFPCLLFLCPEKGISTSLRNVGNIPPDYTASYRRTQCYSHSPPTRRQIAEHIIRTHHLHGVISQNTVLFTLTTYTASYRRTQYYSHSPPTRRNIAEHNVIHTHHLHGVISQNTVIFTLTTYTASYRRTQ